MDTTAPPRPSLSRFAWLSIAAAIVTITLKLGAWYLTGSVGLLSDALESIVNLVAAIAALIALTVAAKGPDEEHAYGHAKAEYFSSGLEGALIILAAVLIVYTAVPRFFTPQPIENGTVGVLVSIVSSVINLFVAFRLLRASQQYRSVTLDADAHHLLTDVWTSVGVVIGIVLVIATDVKILDPIVALLVAANIIWTGVRLVRRSMLGLLDTALEPEDREAVKAILARYAADRHIAAHALRTRQAGARNFVSVHILVPGDWTVREGHQLLEDIEHDIRAAVPTTTVFTHLEPLEDPASWQDVTLDRPVEEPSAQSDGAT
jgi:cation diffusion facilitator family transporter